MNKSSSSINNINQYLLERYPVAWNTRVVWMLLGAVGIHLFFYLWGYISLPTKEVYNIYDSMPTPNKLGSSMFSMAISVVLLVVWATHLLKNNSFKNFYPTRSAQLLKYYLYYFAIIFCCSTFAISYHLGFLSAAVSSVWYDPDLLGRYSITPEFYTAMWYAFGLSSWLFVFRITDMRAIILTAVTIGLLAIAVGLFSLFTGVTGGSSAMKIIPYFVLLLYLAFIIAPYALPHLSKKAKAVCLNITILGVVPILFLIFGIVTLNQLDNSRETLLEYMGVGTHWILLFSGFLFTGLFTGKIKNWRALEEG